MGIRMEKDMRDAFERKYTSHNGYLPNALERYDVENGKYVSVGIQYRWEGYQDAYNDLISTIRDARNALENSGPVADEYRELIRRGVNHQKALDTLNAILGTE